MKQIKTGLIAVSSADAARFVVMSADLDVIEYRDGLKDIKLPADLKRLVSFSTLGHDANIVLWLAGTEKVCVVDLRDKEFDSISLIPGETVFAGLSIHKGRRVALVSRGLDSIYRLNYW